jgi:putative hydrolase of the HAD superfamily
MIDTIAFDADDTLWHNEPNYREVERRFLEMLAGYRIPSEQALNVFHQIEIDNLVYFGYGIRGFILSLIEAAIRVTGGSIRATDVQSVIDLGKGMTNYPITLLDGVPEVLEKLTNRRLLLITKGDSLDQESKIQRSGLARYFPFVEVLVDKTNEAYANLLSKHAIRPERFMMVGNSLRSDIAPVLALGAYAVHVPYPNSWAHESAADLPADRSRFFEIQTLCELPAILAKINHG